MKRHAGLKHGVIFAPAVVRAYRGMVVEVPLHLGAMPGEPTADKLRAALGEFYAGSPIITVAEDGPLPELVLNTDQPAHDGMTLHVRANEGGWHVRLIATLDNLGKGRERCGYPEPQPDDRPARNLWTDPVCVSWSCLILGHHLPCASASRSGICPIYHMASQVAALARFLKGGAGKTSPLCAARSSCVIGCTGEAISLEGGR